MLRHRIPSLLVLVSFLILIGCARNSPVVPSIDNPGTASTPGSSVYSGGHSLMGLWELGIDLERGTIDAVPLRSADWHFNIVPILSEGTPNVKLGFSNILWDASNNLFQVDIAMTHPFPTLVNVPAFDVRGIIFTKGAGYVMQGTNVIMTSHLEPRLTNADGYTRWWNPVEFYNLDPIFGYTDGLYGSPDYIAGYEHTLSGYKYFADSLGAVEPIHNMNTVDRGVFRPTSTNTRRFLIDFGDLPGNWLVVNYAFDACWAPIPGWKQGDAPPQIPDDFPLTSNCPEPYRIKVTESSNSLVRTAAGGTSGTVDLNINIWDWQCYNTLSTVPMEVSVVVVEALALGAPPVFAAPIPGSGAGGHMSTYTATITGSTTEYLDKLDILVAATSSEGDYQNALTGFLADDPLQAFYLHQAATQDGDTYSGWTYRYTKPLYPEWPNQGANVPDIAVYKKSSIIRAAMVDQTNPDYNGTHQNHPDSINEWADDYTSFSEPEHYHMPIDMLSNTGLWNDVDRFCVSDTSTRFFFTSSNIYNEFADGELDPLYSYLTWLSHTYLGNAQAENWFTATFSAGDYPRFYATDPCNGVNIATDFIYNVFLYDVTGYGSANPGVDPQRYVIFRWAPPYDLTSAKWQRPLNVPPNGYGEGYIDRDMPYTHRLAVDDSPPVRDRFYILDSNREIEIVDCDFSKDEFSGSYPVTTVMPDVWPLEVDDILDMEVVLTTSVGEPRNDLAMLCQTDTLEWRIWVLDIDTSTDPAIFNTTWYSDPFYGEAYSMDAIDDPIELHVLSRQGFLVYATVFRDYP